MNWLVLKDHPKVKYMFATNYGDDPRAFDEAYKSLTDAVNKKGGSFLSISPRLCVLRDHLFCGYVDKITEMGDRSYIDLFFHVYPEHALAFQEACDMAKKAHAARDTAGVRDALELAAKCLRCAWAKADRDVPRANGPVQWWESDQ